MQYSLAVHIIIIIISTASLNLTTSDCIPSGYHLLCPKNKRNDEGNKGKSYTYEHQLIVIAFFAVILWFESDLAHGMIDILFIILISDLIAISICMHNSSMSVR